MPKLSYQEAIKWLARDDERDWLEDGIPSLPAALVAVFFKKSDGLVRKDLEKECERMRNARRTGAHIHTQTETR